MLEPYLDRWAVEAYPGGLDIWSGTWRSEDGRHIRVLVAHSATELAGKLAIADEEIGR